MGSTFKPMWKVEKTKDFYDKLEEAQKAANKYFFTIPSTQANPQQAACGNQYIDVEIDWDVPKMEDGMKATPKTIDCPVCKRNADIGVPCWYCGNKN